MRPRTMSIAMDDELHEKWPGLDWIGTSFLQLAFGKSGVLNLIESEEGKVSRIDS